MTYARARLLLGICGVGSLVSLSVVALLTGLPSRFLTTSTDFTIVDIVQLALVTLAFAIWLMPFDLLGGFLLPKTFLRSFESFRFWFWNYTFASLCQFLLFVSIALTILIAGRRFGLAGAIFAIGAVTLLCFVARTDSFRPAR